MLANSPQDVMTKFDQLSRTVRSSECEKRKPYLRRAINRLCMLFVQPVFVNPVLWRNLVKGIELIIHRHAPYHGEPCFLTQSPHLHFRQTGRPETFPVV